MFSVRLVARPDARMVEVPLEIEAELPRDFEGAAVLASSGVPRKVKIRTPKDALKLSTAYRADQLLGEIVKSALRGTPQDVQRVQDAVKGFVRTVRERRQDGAALLVSSNGRGRIDVLEQTPPARAASPVVPAVEPARDALSVPAPDEKQVPGLEAVLAKVAADADRINVLEQRVRDLEAQLSRSTAKTALLGPGIEARGAAQPAARKSSAIDAYADGLREELRGRIRAQLGAVRSGADRTNRAAALAAEADQVFHVASPEQVGTLRDAAAQVTARVSALERLAEELEFYEPGELPLAAQLLARLEQGERPHESSGELEELARKVVASANAPDPVRESWIERAAALAGWTRIVPEAGTAIDPQIHEAVEGNPDTVGALAAAGLRRADGTVLARARALGHAPVEAAPTAEPQPAQEPPGPEPAPQAPAAEPAASVATAEPAAGHANDPFVLARPLVEQERPRPDPNVPAVPLPAPGAAAKEMEHLPPFGDLAGTEEITAEQAATAVTAASKLPKIVAEDLAARDEALAAQIDDGSGPTITSEVEWEHSPAEPVLEKLSEADIQDLSDSDVEEIADADVEEIAELDQTDEQH